MRTLILTALLLTGVATPVLAQVSPDRRDERIERREDRRDDRQEFREDRRDDVRDDRREFRDDVRDDRRELREDRREFRDDRRDLREDRREYRDDRRAYRQDSNARFRGNPYVYPRGYGYRFYEPGLRVPRAYFTSRYYIDRPAFYRLPAVYGGTRWVRIGPDALLIRLRDGIVVRSVRGLFY